MTPSVSRIFRSVVRAVLGRRRIQSLRSLIADSSLFTQQPRMAEGERNLRQRELVATRRAEAQCAARILGVQSLSFLDAEDGSLRADKRVPGRLRAILEREQPHCVYLPSFLEHHRDHRDANGVLFAAAAGTSLQFECRGYEIWTPLFPNCVVKIDATVELKKAAMACYRSQLDHLNYVHALIGLNAHRSLALGANGGGFAEAFQSLPLADYMRLYRAIPRSLL